MKAGTILKNDNINTIAGNLMATAGIPTAITYTMFTGAARPPDPLLLSQQFQGLASRGPEGFRERAEQVGTAFGIGPENVRTLIDGFNQGLTVREIWTAVEQSEDLDDNTRALMWLALNGVAPGQVPSPNPQEDFDFWKSLGNLIRSPHLKGTIPFGVNTLFGVGGGIPPQQ